MCNNVKSGQVNYPKIKCPTHGSNCALLKMKKLRAAFLKKIVENDEVEKKDGIKLEMAHFVKNVAESIVKIEKEESDEKKNKGELTAENAWKRLAPTKKSGKEKSECYEDTVLAEDIKELEKITKESKETLEKSGEELVNYIKTEEFQKHLLTVHGKQYVSAEIAQKVYELPPEESKNKILLIDHIIAEVTDGLTHAKAGREFLEKLFDENELKKLESFSDVWGRVGKIKSTYDNSEKVIKGGAADVFKELEAFNRFFFNISSAITSHISKLVADKTVTKILDFSYDEKLKKIFDFLDKKYGVQLMDMLLERGEQLLKMSDKAFELLSSGKNLKQAFKGITKEIGDIHPDTLGKYDANAICGAWFGLTMDIISLSFAASGFLDKMEKGKGSLDHKDKLDMLQNISGTIKSGGEVLEAYRKAFADNADEAASASISKLSKTIKAFGVVGAVATAIVSGMKSVEGFKENDYEIGIYNAFNACLAVASIPFIIAGAASATVILAVVGLIGAFIYSKIKDPAILDYLERTIWSEQKPGIIKLEDTVDEFYNRLYGTLTIRYHEEDDLKENSYFEIGFNGFSDNTKFYVQLTPKGIVDKDTKKQLVDKKMLHLKNAKPMSEINSKVVPKILKSHFWNDSRYNKSVKIYNIADTWKVASPHMVEGVEFLVEAGYDPTGRAAGNISKMKITAKEDDLELNLNQEAVLFERAYAEDKAKAFGNASKGKRVELSSDNVLYVHTYVRNAKEHEVRIHVKDGILGAMGDYWSKEKLVSSKEEAHNIIPIIVDKYMGIDTNVDIDVELLRDGKVIKKENYGIWTLVKNGYL